MRTITSILTVAFVIVLAAFGNAIVANAGPSAPHQVATSLTSTEHYASEICFPRKDWNAYYEDDPCDTIYRPFEDGSSQLILGTVGADAATCVIPNPYEERGKFVIHCHRVSNR